MNYNVLIAMGFSIGIPGMIGLFRYPKVPFAYHPFLCLLWIGFANELLNFFLLKLKHERSINVTTNVYLLLEAVLIAEQFRRWQLFGRQKGWPILVFSTLVSFWTAENFVIRSIRLFSSYFDIFHAFLVTVFSLLTVNHLVVRERAQLTRNASFLICIGFVFYFASSAFVEAFYLYGATASLEFQIYVTRILAFINLFTNLLYATAVVWIPKKQDFFV